MGDRELLVLSIPVAGGSTRHGNQLTSRGMSWQKEKDASFIATPKMVGSYLRSNLREGDLKW
jgi:hypothetical protein